jgi:hypothetical protein
VEHCYLNKKDVVKMGNIIKINMYVEMKKRNKNNLKLKNIEEIILEYNNWIKKTNREDKIETYEKFLQAQ